jgi:hypothetical protein
MPGPEHNGRERILMLAKYVVLLVLSVAFDRILLLTRFHGPVSMRKISLAQSGFDTTGRVCSYWVGLRIGYSRTMFRLVSLLEVLRFL